MLCGNKMIHHDFNVLAFQRETVLELLTIYRTLKALALHGYPGVLNVLKESLTVLLFLLIT